MWLVIAVLNGKWPTFIHNSAKARNCTYLGVRTVTGQVKTQNSIQEKTSLQCRQDVLCEINNTENTELLFYTKC